MRRAVFLVILALLASTGGAFAQRRGGDGVLPLDRILPEVRRSHPGQFYDADGPRPGPDGREQYRLKWMRPDGRVEWLDADARTGRVLGPSDRRQDFSDRPRGFEQRDFGQRNFDNRDFGGQRFDRGDRGDRGERRDRFRRGR